jgi:hypothetical protein
MKRLLLSLCLVGVVFSGHTPLVIETAQGPPPSIKQLVEARAVPPPLSPAIPSMPHLQSTGIEQVAVRSPAMAGEDTQLLTPPRADIQGEPLPTGESSEPSVSPGTDAEKHEANWVVVIRWATVHSGPLVSAPIVGSYSVGTELQLTDYRQGWFRVLDPATSQRGWIYEKYYLQAIRGPGQMVAALQKPTIPKQNVVNGRKPIPHIRRAARPGKKSQPIIASAHRYRYETVASILDRALRP